MKRAPTLSVIMPARNAEGTILAAVSSVLESTFDDFEFIMVDDGSTDQTWGMIQSLRDPRLRPYSNPEPGLCRALNLAVSRCRGAFIARMDADDICDRRRFECQLAAIRDHGWDVAGGLVRIVDRANQPVPSYQRYQSWINANRDDASIRAHRFVESPLANPTTVARREVYEIPFREGPFPEDYEFWLEAMRRPFVFGKVNEVVLDWIDSPHRTTRRDPRYSHQGFDTCRRKHLLLGPLKHQRTIDLWGAGQTGKPWLRWWHQRGGTVRGLIDVSPKKIGQRIHQVQVRSPEALRPPDGVPLVVAVGAAKAREEIESFLKRLGYRIGENVWVVA